MALSSRRFEIDLLKAAGILAVVLIHSIRPPFSPQASAIEVLIGALTRFAVPGFLAASGYLYGCAGPASAAVTWRRLRRILLPYLLASAAAQLFWLGFDGRAIAPGALLEQLALASSFGPYYYVLIAALCVVLAPLLQRLDSRMLALATAAALLAQGLCWTLLGLDVFWALRNPLYWLGFFLAGWWLGTREPGVTRWLVSHGNRLALACGAGCVGLGMFAPLFRGAPSGKGLLLLSVWCVLGLLVGLGVGRSGAHPLVRRLSDSSYTVYLFHLFFVLPLQRWLPASPGESDPVAILVPWFAGIAGSLALAAAGRALLGPSSRALLGS